MNEDVNYVDSIGYNLSEKEKSNKNRNRAGRYVFLSWYFNDFKHLSETEQQELIKTVREPHELPPEEDGSLADWNIKPYEVMKLAFKRLSVVLNHLRDS